MTEQCLNDNSYNSIHQITKTPEFLSHADRYIEDASIVSCIGCIILQVWDLCRDKWSLRLSARNIQEKQPFCRVASSFMNNNNYLIKYLVHPIYVPVHSQIKDPCGIFLFNEISFPVGYTWFDKYSVMILNFTSTGDDYVHSIMEQLKIQ